MPESELERALQRLESLREQGLLTEAEYEAARRRAVRSATLASPKQPEGSGVPKKGFWRRLKTSPRWVKVILVILGLFIVLVVLAGVFGSDEVEQANGGERGPNSTATPTPMPASSPTSSVAATPTQLATSTPTPTPTPRPTARPTPVRTPAPTRTQECPTATERAWGSEVFSAIAGVPNALGTLAELFELVGETPSVMFVDEWVVAVATGLVVLDLAADDLGSISAPTSRTRAIQGTIDSLARELSSAVSNIARGIDNLDIGLLERGVDNMVRIGELAGRASVQIDSLCQ